MSLFTSPTSINHLDQLSTSRSPSDEITQLLLKQFLSQNKNIIEGNQFLIEELRKLREIIGKQNVRIEFINFERCLENDLKFIFRKNLIYSNKILSRWMSL